MEPIKILSIQRRSFEKDRLFNMNMPMEVLKQPDGTYKASVRGQADAFSAAGTTQSDALFALKQVVKDKMLKGDFSGVKSSTV